MLDHYFEFLKKLGGQ